MLRSGGLFVRSRSGVQPCAEEDEARDDCALGAAEQFGHLGEGGAGAVHGEERLLVLLRPGTGGRFGNIQAQGLQLHPDGVRGTAQLCGHFAARKVVRRHLPELGHFVRGPGFIEAAVSLLHLPVLFGRKEKSSHTRHYF